MSTHTPRPVSAWILPDPVHKPLKAGLYLIATPIGNLRDITLRALDTLSAVDTIYCEDTRISGKLLSTYGIKKKLEIYNDHSDSGKRAEILQRIQNGEALALISDAGTPLISDPGYKLVEDLKAKGLYVTSLPGANAPLTALQLSGLPSNAFTFIGFLPPKSGARQSLLRLWQNTPSTLIAFETGPRLTKSLADIAEVLGNRTVAVTRELTKLYEEIQCGPLETLITHYESREQPKGEIVLVIAPPVETTISEEDLSTLLKTALKTMRTKEAAAHVSTQTGASRSALYTLALTLTESPDAD